MTQVWILFESGRVVPVQIKEAVEIYGLLPPHDLADRCAIGDLECRLKPGVYMHWTATDGQKSVNLTAARILLDCRVLGLEAPCVLDRSDLMSASFACFPTKQVILYKCGDDGLVSYTRHELRTDWRMFFDGNALYVQLAQRYTDFSQPLLECDRLAKPSSRETTKALIAYYLKEEPFVTPRQLDRLSQAMIGAALFMLLGSKEWAKLPNQKI